MSRPKCDDIIPAAVVVVTFTSIFDVMVSDSVSISISAYGFYVKRLDL